MNELELVRELRAEIPGPGGARLAAGRERLLSGMAAATAPAPVLGRAPGVRYWRRMAVATGVAVVILAVAVVALPGAAPRSATTAISRVRLTAQVLRAAALSAGTRPAVRPSPQQWFFVRSVQWSLGQGVSSNVSWLRFDALETATRLKGRLIVYTSRAPASGGQTPLAAFGDDATPLTAYDAMASLPASPTALLAVVYRFAAADPGSVTGAAASPLPHPSRGQLEFEFLTGLLWNASEAAPARADAAVFRALAAIPGVSAQRGITDAAGRPAIGLSDQGDEQQILLDPRTYQVTGVRTVSNGTWPVNVMKRGGPTWPKGKVLLSSTWAKIEPVDRPGER
jgi:hypothetical protein